MPLLKLPQRLREENICQGVISVFVTNHNEYSGEVIVHWIGFVTKKIKYFYSSGNPNKRTAFVSSI